MRPDLDEMVLCLAQPFPAAVDLYWDIAPKGGRQAWSKAIHPMQGGVLVNSSHAH